MLGINACSVEASLIAAVRTLAAYIVVLLVVLLILGVTLSTDGEDIVGKVKLDVFLFYARQISLEDEMIALILDICRESCHLGLVVAEEGALKLV